MSTRAQPDGNQIVFTTDVGGYGNVYLADVPEFDTLPRLEDV
ncbi:MAG: oligogalacturonate lyase family protein [Gammaproteobacteria bacterium]|nr:oligogalacturonate lyase family protein [Gammaproteobacteria bacterium]